MPEKKEDLESKVKENIQIAITKIASMPKNDYSLIIFDVDYFKAINDLFSYGQGDQVLRGVKYLLDKVHEERRHFLGVYGNYGGDEFLMAVPYSDENEAYAFAERLRETVSNHPFLDVRTGERFKQQVTLSLGVSSVDLKEATASCINSSEAAEGIFDTLLKQANIALDYAKFIGKNKVEKFEQFLDNEWARIGLFRRAYSKLIYENPSLLAEKISSDSSVRDLIMCDAKVIQLRVNPRDVRTLAMFADVTYKSTLFQQPEDIRSQIIDGLQKLQNQAQT